MTDAPAPTPVDNAPPPAPAPAAPSAQPSWRDGLPDDIKSSPSLGKFETLEGLSKSYINLEKMLGTEKVPIPKEGDTAGWDAAYKALGRPDNAEGYGFKKPDNSPAGLEYSPELDARIAKAFHAKGLNKAQAEGIRNELIAILGEGHTAQTTQAEIARADGEARLKQEWGRAYDERLAASKKVMEHFEAKPEFIAYLESSGLGNHPAMAEFLYNVGVKMMPDTVLHGDRNQPIATPAEMQKQINDYKFTHAAALFDRSHPEHAMRSREWYAMFERKNG